MQCDKKIIDAKLNEFGVNLGKEFKITDNGVFEAKATKDGTQWVPISSGEIVFPMAIIEDAESGRTFIELSYWNTKKGEFSELIFERSILGSAGELVKQVSPFIIGIDSLNAKKLVKYFTTVLQFSKNTIKQKSLLTHAGWWGNEFVPYSDRYILHCSDASPLKHIRPVGEESEWLDVVSKWYNKSLYARISIAVAFASPLLERVGSLPFIVHYSGNTGCGKTFYQRLCASVYGGCNDNQFLFSMNSTDNGLESTLIELNSLPAIVDEIQIQSNRFNFSELIYRITEGASKRRCTIDGTLNGNSKGIWKLIFFSSGEEFFSTNSRTKGVENRIIDLPLPTDKNLESEMVEDVYTLIKNNGHAGSKYIKELQKLTEDDIRKMQQKYREIVKEVCPKATGKQIPAIALLLIGDELCRKYVLTDVTENLTANDLAPYIKTDTQVNNQVKAFITLINLFHQNQTSFVAYDNRKKELEEMAQIEVKNLWGFYNTNYLWVQSSVFDTAVREAGNDPKSLKNWMKKNGILIPDEDNPKVYSHKIRRSAFKGQFYKISKSKIDEILEKYVEE